MIRRITRFRKIKLTSQHVWFIHITAEVILYKQVSHTTRNNTWHGIYYRIRGHPQLNRNWIGLTEDIVLWLCNFPVTTPLPRLIGFHIRERTRPVSWSRPHGQIIWERSRTPYSSMHTKWGLSMYDQRNMCHIDNVIPIATNMLCGTAEHLVAKFEHNRTKIGNFEKFHL
jgi:hypothetical protein